MQTHFKWNIFVSMTLYLISGLGADQRILDRLQIDNIETIYIEWLRPHKRESISDYAARMAEAITDDDFMLLGLSFGGIIAQEIARIKKPRKIILISSVKSPDEIPWYYKIGRWLPLYLLIPNIAIRNSHPLVKIISSAETEAGKKVGRAMLADIDPVLIKWSIGALVNWRGNENSTQIHHIHGTADMMLPYRYVRGTIPIEGGKHFMVFDRADEISAIINRVIDV